jgi:hypothetical protein
MQCIQFYFNACAKNENLLSCHLFFKAHTTPDIINKIIIWHLFGNIIMFYETFNSYVWNCFYLIEEINMSSQLNWKNFDSLSICIWFWSYPELFQLFLYYKFNFMQKKKSSLSDFDIKNMLKLEELFHSKFLTEELLNELTSLYVKAIDCVNDKVILMKKYFLQKMQFVLSCP